MMNAWARRDMDLNKDGVLDRNEIETFTKKILGDDYDKAVANPAARIVFHRWRAAANRVVSGDRVVSGGDVLLSRLLLQIVDRVFDELDKEKKGHVDGRA
eukprot:3672843-Rhodomonas_salina.1